MKRELALRAIRSSSAPWALCTALLLGAAGMGCGDDSGSGTPDTNTENETDTDTIDNPTDNEADPFELETNENEIDTNPGDEEGNEVIDDSDPIEGDSDPVEGDPDPSEGDPDPIDESDTDGGTCDATNCPALEGKYCQAGRCLQIACTECTSDTQCASQGTNYKCQEATYPDGSKAKICMQACSADNTSCPSGYECSLTAQACRPKAKCGGGGQQTSTKRDKACQNNSQCEAPQVCIKRGDLQNPPVGQCGEACQGQLVQGTCKVGELCLPAQPNIGIRTSGCRTACNTANDDPNQCPGGTLCLALQQGSTNGICLTWDWTILINNGQRQEGETCQFGGQTTPQTECLEGFSCIPTISQTEGQCFKICTPEGADAAFNAAGPCTNGTQCGGVFSDLPYFGVCEIAGNAQAGEACKFRRGNQDTDFCAAGLNCLRTGFFELGEICETDEDCTTYPGNGDCIPVNPAFPDRTKVCAYSYCSPECTNGQCADPFEPLNIPASENSPAQCLCVKPDPTGEAAAGDACQEGNINFGAGFCAPGLKCVAEPAVSKFVSEALATGEGQQIAVSFPCNGDADCSSFPGRPQCVDLGLDGRNRPEKRCGWSVCAEAAPASPQDCQSPADGTLRTIDTGDGRWCVPYPVGTAKLGGACRLNGSVNAQASACQAGMFCFGLDPNSPPSDPPDPADVPRVNCGSNAAVCATANQGLFATNPSCVSLNDGSGSFCGTSFCSGTCTTDADCRGAPESADGGFGPSGICQRDAQNPSAPGFCLPGNLGGAR